MKTIHQHKTNQTERNDQSHRPAGPGSAKRRSAEGFTLIELLVVITIIAILSSIVIPGTTAVVGMARRSTAGANARQIVIGLRGYAMDNGGRFPDAGNQEGGTINTSNDAFREIIDYMDNDERPFVVSGSAWGASADMKTGNPSQILEPGENHFAYISGLGSESRGSWPLIVDGTAGDGTYSEIPGERGGIWKGKYAVVARVDGSFESIRLKGPEGHTYIPKFDDPTANALDVGRYMGRRARLLDPAGTD